MPRISPDLLSEVVGPRGRLIVLSNRGPLTFEADPDAPCGLTATRGSGGLVTALAELGRHAPVTWIATARSAADALVAPILARLGPAGSGIDSGAAITRSGDDSGTQTAIPTRHPNGYGGAGSPSGHSAASRSVGVVTDSAELATAMPESSSPNGSNGTNGRMHGSNGNGHGTPPAAHPNGNGHATTAQSPHARGLANTVPVAELDPADHLDLTEPDASTGPDDVELEPAAAVRLVRQALGARRDGMLQGDAPFAPLVDSRTNPPASVTVAASGGALAIASKQDGSLVERVAELVESRLPGQDIALRFEVLPEDVRHGHYEVIANPLLWFLQHQMFALPYGPNIDGDLVAAWRTGYRPANRRLADAAVDAAKGSERPTFLIQDYHLYLAAERIRERRPDATILHFTHIPWPSVSVWQTLPQGMRRAICEGLLAADIVGLQTDRYATNFLESVESFVRDARVDGDGRTVRWRGRRIRVGTYPISLDPDALGRFARSQAVESRVARLRARLERAGNPRLIVRADRIEPSKNALRGFLAFEDLLRRRPELRTSVRFIAVQAPTRTALREYAEYAAAVREVVARINGMAEPDEQPVWIYDGSDYAMAIAALRLADAVLVNPVVDGMNLVAKEAVLVSDRDPVLVLSETAGAAEQLARNTLTVAPADIVGTSEALERALIMPRGERHERARRLRQSVRDEDIGWWLNRQLRDLAAIRRDERPPSRRLRDTVRLVEASVE